MNMITYQCPNCGGELTFDPQLGQLKCAFCQSQFSQGEADELYAQREQQAMDEAAAQQQADRQSEHPEDESNFREHTRVYLCNSCGAQIIADDTTTATLCCYCHDPVVLTDRLVNDRCPSKVVPFGFDKEAAKACFLAWAGKKWFLPKDFLDSKQVEKLAGVYYPFWLTDCDLSARYTGVGTTVRTWTSGDYRNTETTTYNLVREGNIHLEDIVTPALTRMEKNLVQGILPFPVSAVEPFNMRCLSGFLAEGRDIEKETVQEPVNARIRQYSQTLLKNTVEGYSSVSDRGSDCTVHKSHWDYTLMPVWILTYHDRKRDKRYTYAINGQTKAIFGALPTNPGKLAVLFGGVGVAAFLLTLLIGGLLL